MGWKATKNIKREKAIQLIIKRVMNSTNDELGDALEALGYGDDMSLPHYGYNFSVIDEDETEEEN